MRVLPVIISLDDCLLPLVYRGCGAGNKVGRHCCRGLNELVDIRYIVSDVDAAIRFYTEQLGFKLEMHPAPPFAILSKGNLHLLINRPGAGGAGQSSASGEAPAPGGWNRFQLEFDDLAAAVARLKSAGCRFRSEIISGNGGKQILVEDPSGNPIELFEPYREGPRRG